MYRVVYRAARLRLPSRAIQNFSSSLQYSSMASPTPAQSKLESSSFDQTEAQPPKAESEGQSESRPALLALPPAEGGDGSGPTQLDVNGAGVKLDHLGPMVVNQNGTLSRISNWDKMSVTEQKNTLRIIGKRNRERLDDLKTQQGKEGQEKGDSS